MKINEISNKVIKSINNQIFENEQKFRSELDRINKERISNKVDIQYKISISIYYKELKRIPLNSFKIHIKEATAFFSYNDNEKFNFSVPSISYPSDNFEDRISLMKLLSDEFDKGGNIYQQMKSDIKYLNEFVEKDKELRNVLSDEIEKEKERRNKIKRDYIDAFFVKGNSFELNSTLKRNKGINLGGIHCFNNWGYKNNSGYSYKYKSEYRDTQEVKIEVVENKPNTVKIKIYLGTWTGYKTSPEVEKSVNKDLLIDNIVKFVVDEDIKRSIKLAEALEL